MFNLSKANQNLMYTLIVCGLLIINFQNCSNAEFSDVSGSNTKFDDNDEDETDEITKTCLQQQNAGTLLELNKQITFDDTKVESGRQQVCLFNQNGNLGILNGFQQARYEQSRNINLPANAELCDLNIEMETQSLRYDDMFYLSFNDIVIASNSSNDVIGLDTSPLFLSNQNSLSGYKYNWSQIAGSSFNNNGGTDYCLGQSLGYSNCQWPDTEQTGDFVFDYSPEILINLGARSSNSNHELRFVITGDNDVNIDCYHESFQFNLTAKYYLK